MNTWARKDQVGEIVTQKIAQGSPFRFGSGDVRIHSCAPGHASRALLGLISGLKCCECHG